MPNPERIRRSLLASLAALAFLACGGEDAERAGTTTAAESTAATPPDSAAPPDTMTQDVIADTVAGDTGTRSQDTSRVITSHDSLPVPRLPLEAPRDTGTSAQQVRLLRQTSAAYADMRTLRANFTMETENPLLRTKVNSRGVLIQQRPDRIALRFEEPAGDIILSDGQYFWVYYPSSTPDQVIRAQAAPGAAGGVDLWAQFVGDPVARFEHTYHGRETVDGRETAVFTLDPRGDPGYRLLKVWLDTRDHLVRRFEITENNGVIRRVRLSDLQINPSLPANVFRFEPPPGVRVIER